MLNWQNRICGGITVLQQRSGTAPCQVSAVGGGALLDVCSGDDDDTRPFGRCHTRYFTSCTPDNKFGTGANVSRSLQLDSGSILETSFFVQLGPDESSARAQTAALRAGGWVDGSTRRLQVFVHVWNLNTDLLQAHEMSVVFRDGGITRVFFTERHLRSEMYNMGKPEQLLRLALEAVVVAFLAYFWIVELEEMYTSYRGNFSRLYFRSGWNMVDVLHCASLSASVVTWVVCVARLPRQHFLSMFDADDDVASSHALALLDFYALYDVYIQLSGATVFFNLLKMLKTFRFHLKTSAVVNTISNMAAPLFGFLASFSIIFFCFVYVAYIDFGLFFLDWHSIAFAAGSAVNAIFQALPISDIDRLPLFADYYFGWQFAFVFAINFISLNLIVAIIIEGYILSLERKKIKNFSSQSICDQFAVAVITIICAPFAAMPLGPWTCSNRICDRFQGLHEQISGIFGRRLQVHYAAPRFFLILCDRIVIPQHDEVTFGFILAEIHKKCAIPGDAALCREVVSEILLHFMENMKTRSKNTELHFKPRTGLPKPSRQLKTPANAEPRAIDAGKFTVQLRDESVLMLRSHARSLQRHSDSLHSVGFECLACARFV
jgi:hypothetical protein